ncbi:hypothetical protein DFQ29_009719 [Apophysomyces sp. BC1021]|nr:hypothetical protein DFQ29_009719 [Apophysomyces sp. BC1021]
MVLYNSGRLKQCHTLNDYCPIGCYAFPRPFVCSKGASRLYYVSTSTHARKSPLNETDETKIRLPQPMIIKLQNRCFCEHIYVSPKTSSTKSIMERDYGDVDRDIIVGQLSGYSDDTQDMLVYLASTLTNVRSCIISYAGLSNDPNNIYEFLRAYKKAKEIVVDHGERIEVIQTSQLFYEDKNKLKMFKPRNGCIKPSVV